MTIEYQEEYKKVKEKNMKKIFFYITKQTNNYKSNLKRIIKEHLLKKCIFLLTTKNLIIA